jgi:hypothetical protein
MQILPLEAMRLHVTASRVVLVGAYEHNGSIWWIKLPDPPEPLARGGNFEGVVVNAVDRGSIV